MPIQLGNILNTPINGRFNNYVSSVIGQPDGKIIIGGAFSTWNGTTTIGNLVRINTDDTLDTSFNTNIGTGSTANSYLYIALQSDGKILVGGSFSTWNGATVGNIVRLNANGTRDTAFSTNIGTGGNSYIRAIAVQTDGKILIGGNFTTWNGATVNGIVRLNADGTRDTAFTTNTGAGSYHTDYGGIVPICAITVQSDGKILVGGQFNTWNGASISGLVRLNSNGTRDTAFNTNIGTGPLTGWAPWLTIVWGITLQTDGKILIGGNFDQWSSITVGYIVRLNADGTRDTAFTTNTGTAANYTVYATTIQSDGKILVVGYFPTWNGTSVGCIVRLNADGTRDTTFTTNAGTGMSTFAGGGTRTAPYITSNRRIVIGMEGRYWNGVDRSYLVRIGSNGQEVPTTTPYTKVAGVWKAAKAVYNKVGGNWYSSFLQGGINDARFTLNNGTGANLSLYCVALQTDKKIIAGGSFSAWNGTTVGRIVRLNSDGTRDTTFTTNTGTGASDGDIYTVTVMPSGKIVIGGAFFTWNGTNVVRIVRLNADGTRDTAFTANTGNGANGGDIYSSAAQVDGKVILGGEIATWANNTAVGNIVRLNADGTRDTAFSTNIGTGSGTYGYIFALTLDTVQQILVGGFFTKWNGTTVGRIVRLSSNGARDTTFTTNTGTGANGGIRAITIQADGKILVGGAFTAWNGTTVNRIVRLNSDGTRDTTFTTNTGTGANSDVSSIKVQSDGKILVGGYFTTWNGTTVGRIVRLNADGTRDTTFTTNTGTGANGNVYGLALQDDKKFIVGGTGMTSWNGTSVGYITRIGGEIAI